MKSLLLLTLLVAAGLTVTAQKGNESTKTDTSFNKADLFYTKEISKHCPGCSYFPPGTYIRRKKAQRRITEFNNKKTACNLKGLATDAVYSDTGTLAFLNMLTHSKKNYSGFRAYWVIYPNQGHRDSGSELVPYHQHNRLALVFVPTFPRAHGQNRNYHKDDTTNCVIIRGNSFEKIPPNYVRMWMQKADNQVLQPMDREGKNATQNPEYKETRSLWYSITYIKPQGEPFRNGLIDIINCRMNCDCKSIHVNFAAFTLKSGGQNKHQLCAIFMIGSDRSDHVAPFNSNRANHVEPFNTDISLWYSDLSPFAKHHFLKGNAAADGGSGGSDTGKPCPPPSPCSDNVGALLSSPN